MHSRLFVFTITLFLLIGGVAAVNAAPAAAAQRPSATLTHAALKTAENAKTLSPATSPQLPNWVGPPLPSWCTPSADGTESGPDQNGVNWICICEVVMSNPDSPLSCRWTEKKIDRKLISATWINFNSHLYLDLQGPNTNNGDIIHQWTYTGASNQFWRRSNPTDAPFAEFHNLYDGHCIGVDASSRNFGASIIQWGCNGSPDQQWAFAWTGQTVDNSPVFNIVNRNSHECLGISASRVDRGAPAVQWWCNGSADQEWY